jgi:RHS repeat-associated protein
VTVNPATNRITTSGYGYDSNGNLTSMPLLTLSYDIENRLVQATSSLNGTERYVYDPGNQRVWKQGKVYFYGVEGNLLGTYGDGANNDYNVYFGGKLIWQEAAAGLAAHPINADRMSSTVKHFPYGEEPTTTTQDRSKFATYYRDATTALDYAQNRYYARTIGRFTSPDPYRASGGPADPQSWNRYAYVQNDPVNYIDPRGLEVIAVGDGSFYVEVTAAADPLMDAMIQMLRFAGKSYTGPRLEQLPDTACWPGSYSPPPAAPELIHVANFSTTSAQAVGVQNSLRWIGAALGLDADCASLLSLKFVYTSGPFL